MRRLCSAWVLGIVGLLSGCGSSAVPPTHGACVTAPGNAGGLAIPDGGRTTVRLGALVYVELVKPEKYASGSLPVVFPWLAPTSSKPDILARVTLCPRLEVSALALKLTAFRALHAGTVTIVAVLAPAWNAVRPALRRGLRPYRSTVVIQP